MQDCGIRHISRVLIFHARSHTYQIDKRNGNYYWRDAINKEMKNVLKAFVILELGENPHQNLK